MYSQEQPRTFESGLSSYLYSGVGEKTYIDKIVAKEEIDEIKDLMQKDDLTRNDLLRINYLLTAKEVKLINLGEWDRYYLGKFFAWIRDFTATTETFYDYKEKIEREKIEVNQNTSKMLEDIRVKLIHSTKALCDVYLYLGRSTLSLGGTAIDMILKNRYEYAYPQGPQQNVQPQRHGLFNVSLK